MRPRGKVLLDTNVFSYLMAENALGLRYAELLNECLLCISFVTPEESYYGADRRGWGRRRRRELEACIAGYVLLPSNLEIARISGRIRAERDRHGRPISRPDAWIAATALWYGLPAVSHDGDLLGIDGLFVITFCGHSVEDVRVGYGYGETPAAYEVSPAGNPPLSNAQLTQGAPH